MGRGLQGPGASALPSKGCVEPRPPACRLSSLGFPPRLPGPTQPDETGPQAPTLALGLSFRCWQPCCVLRMAPQDCPTFALGVHIPAPLAPKLPPCAAGDTPRNQAPQTAQGQRAAAGLQRAPGLGARARPGAGTQLPPGPPDGHQASGSAGTAAQPPGLSPFLGARPHTAPGLRKPVHHNISVSSSKKGTGSPGKQMHSGAVCSVRATRGHPPGPARGLSGTSTSSVDRHLGFWRGRALSQPGSDVSWALTRRLSMGSRGPGDISGLRRPAHSRCSVTCVLRRGSSCVWRQVSP